MAFTLVLGDDWISLYQDNLLRVEGVTLSFGDILQACKVPCDIATADLEWASHLSKAGKGFPTLLSDVPLEGREHLTSAAEEVEGV